MLTSYDSACRVEKRHHGNEDIRIADQFFEMMDFSGPGAMETGITRDWIPCGDIGAQCVHDARVSASYITYSDDTHAFSCDRSVDESWIVRELAGPFDSVRAGSEFIFPGIVARNHFAVELWNSSETAECQGETALGDGFAPEVFASMIVQPYPGFVGSLLKLLVRRSVDSDFLDF